LPQNGKDNNTHLLKQFHPQKRNTKDLSNIRKKIN
jgi:hypothetical protein